MSFIGLASLLVEGLEKSSLANCDVVGSSQSAPLKGKGKLSSLGKIFKPWKWRKKRTSDKFQDLSKGTFLCSHSHFLCFLMFGTTLMDAVQVKFVLNSKYYSWQLSEVSVIHSGHIQ